MLGRPRSQQIPLVIRIEYGYMCTCASVPETIKIQMTNWELRGKYHQVLATWVVLPALCAG